MELAQAKNNIMAIDNSLQHNRAQDAHKNNGMGARIALIVCGLLLIGVIAFGILPRMRQNKALAEDAKKEKNAQPQVVYVKPHPSPDADLTLPGTTQAIKDAVISARTTGYVTKYYVEIGSRVKAGQLLAEITAPDVEASARQAQQQTQQAIAGVRQAESDVANKQAVVSQYQSNVKQAQANVEQSRAQLADAEAKRAQAQAQLGTARAQQAQQEQVVGIKKAALAQTQTQLDLAAVTLNRYKTLLKSGYVALQDVDQSQANYDNARSAVASAQADLRSAEENVRAAQQQVQSARSNVNATDAEVTAAQKNVKAVLATVDAARSTVAAARANVRQSQANVQANQSNVGAAQANAQRIGVTQEFSRVTAPFAGVITARNVDVGTLINAGGGAGGSGSASSGASQGSASTASATPSTAPNGGLFGLADVSVLRILVSVPEAYAKQMQPGAKTNLVIREFPGRTFEGEISNVSGAIDAVSRTLLTEVRIPNQDGALLPGMYAQVHFDLPKTRASLRIPSNTLMYDAQGTRVATLTAENKIHYVPVRVGRDFGTEIEVVEGLTGQENVVTNPSDDLGEGLKVQGKLAPPPPAPPAAPGQTGQPGQEGKPPAAPPNGQTGQAPPPGGPSASRPDSPASGQPAAPPPGR